MVKCPNCGKEITNGKFCGNCGTPVPEINADSMDELNINLNSGFCGNCGAKLKPNAKFCPACGSPIVGASYQNSNLSTINSNIQPKSTGDNNLNHDLNDNLNNNLNSNLNTSFNSNINVSNKSLTLALLLSFFIPGLGQIYLGNVKFGIFIFILCVLFTFTIIFPVGAFIWFVCYAYNLYSVYKYYNENFA
ncbi:MAG: zinc-ribbon domain-containing protein [Methanobrevibacter sp.]